jgi:hypothetical protein
MTLLTQKQRVLYLANRYEALLGLFFPQSTRRSSLKRRLVFNLQFVDSRSGGVVVRTYLELQSSNSTSWTQLSIGLLFGHRKPASIFMNRPETQATWFEGAALISFCNLLPGFSRIFAVIRDQALAITFYFYFFCSSATLRPECQGTLRVLDLPFSNLRGGEGCRILAQAVSQLTT